MPITPAASCSQRLRTKEEERTGWGDAVVRGVVGCVIRSWRGWGKFLGTTGRTRSPQPPPRSGEGEQGFLLPLSASGRGLGRGVGSHCPWTKRFLPRQHPIGNTKPAEDSCASSPFHPREKKKASFSEEEEAFCC